jgi:ATP-binding cassette, subfamily B, bacterial CvaB/MchF/RaxB
LPRNTDITLQSAVSECGYVCICAVLSFFDRTVSADQVKRRIGSTARGLTLRQLRDGLQTYGFQASVVAFDKTRVDAYPVPGIILLQQGHYVVLKAFRRGKFDLFDPAKGWRRENPKHLAKEANGFAITVESFSAPAFTETPNKPRSILHLVLKQNLTKLGVKVLVVALTVQALMLAIPLLTQQTMDAFIPNVPGVQLPSSLATTLAIGFAALTLISSLLGVVASLGTKVIAKRLSLSSAAMLYDKLAQQPPAWFEEHPQSHIFNQYGALISLQQFYAELVQNILAAVLIGIIGIFAMFYISPWLVLPGLIVMCFSSLIDFSFRAGLQEVGAVSLQAQNAQRAFIYDVVTQIPLLARLGSVWRVRAHFRRRVRTFADAQLHTARVSGAQNAIHNAVKVFENLIFVCMAGYFVNKDALTIGVFVAAGLYKDQFANGLSMLFQLWQRYELLQPHRKQLEALFSTDTLEEKPPHVVSRGDIQLHNVSFRYGSLDPWVLEKVNLNVVRGECIVLMGPSGAGKSTLIKMICGSIVASEGEILVDGVPPVLGMRGVGSVFQSDCLVADSIRENVSFFRGGITDDQIWHSLGTVGLKDFVMTLPMKLDTQIGEGLAGLSGGQKQRILIARAIVELPILLVLDEATASLDVAGEAAIFCALKASGATLVVCAHRPEVWGYADAVYSVAGRRVSKLLRDIKGQLMTSDLKVAESLVG